MANNDSAYKNAGVDTKEGERAVKLMGEHVKKTFGKGVLGGLGGFGNAVDRKSVCRERV